MILPIQDYFLVSIERKYEDSTSKGGIILLNAAWIEDSSMEAYENKRIYGKVLSVPESFSTNPYRAVDDGMPTYRKFIGHDDIVDKINRGYTNHADKTYYPSTFDKYEVVTMEDVAKKVDVKVGDTVYFMPQVTEPENFIEKNKDGLVYKVAVTEIFFRVREDLERGSSNNGDEEFYHTEYKETQGEWVLIKPNMETWEEITSPSGIIKKIAPEKKWLEGIVAYSHYDHCKPGMKIAYLPNADCEVKINGEIYFVMPVQDVMGQFKQQVI